MSRVSPKPAQPPADDRGALRARRFVASCSLALGDIKIAHSVFALPFAVFAAALTLPAGQPAATTATQFVLVIVAMVAARTVAMLVNRLADRRFDATNPRTASRALASGRLRPREAAATTALAAALFLAVCAAFWALFANPWPSILGLPTLALVSFYSFTKRFTPAAHLFLGLALAASPVAAAIAVSPASVGLTGDVTPAGTAVYFLAVFVALWVAGFDVLYALQDIDHDRATGLRSIPASLGPRASSWVARALHAAAFGALLLSITADPRLGTITTVAAALVGATLIAEHTLLARRGLAALPMAFFTLNGVISLTLGALGVLDLSLR